MKISAARIGESSKAIYVELYTGETRLAELHWYECHGVGKRKMKIKRLLD